MDAILQTLAQTGGVIGAVAAVFIWQSITAQKRMAERLDAIQDKLIDLVSNNTTALHEQAEALKELSQTLRERPCIMRSQP